MVQRPASTDPEAVLLAATGATTATASMSAARTFFTALTSRIDYMADSAAILAGPCRP
mgnify:FL=1